MWRFSCVFFIPFLFTASVFAQSADEGISLSLRNLLESVWPEGEQVFGNEALYHTEEINKFYANRFFQPVWIENGQLICEARELKYQVEQSRFDGLIPEDYHLKVLDQLFGDIQTAGKEEGSGMHLAVLDIFLTDAYFQLAQHLYYGKVSPDAIKANWNIQRKVRELDLGLSLKSALQGDGVKSSLQKLWPKYQLYPSMRNSLRAYLQQSKSAPSWPKLTVTESVKPNEVHQIIPAVRERLLFWKDVMPYEVEEKSIYDSVLLDGVLRFQKRYGLNADGVIGQGTLEALNESPEDLTKKVAVNMERLRWLPDTVIQNRFILVNIANFQMDFLQGNGLDTLLSSTAIVGRAYRKTPIFNSEMSYLVFSPTWTVPPTILRNDVIPAVKKDVGYLKSKHMRVLTYAGKEVPPHDINWSQVRAGSFPYIIRQDPGHHNALGLVKFMFPNRYNVYIHDTPDKALFDRDTRTLSSGCIRIQRAFDLAKELLKGQEEWTDQAINDAMHQDEEKVVSLKEKVPVIILYLTFWTDKSGAPHIRRDVYQRDEQVFRALSALP